MNLILAIIIWKLLKGGVYILAAIALIDWVIKQIKAMMEARNATQHA